MTLKFEYYQICAAVDFGDHTESFFGADGTPMGALAEAEAANEAEGGSGVFWTLYGMAGADTVAIGDFTTFDAAYEVMCAILLPMRDAITILEDICNQSSNEERL